MLERQVPVAYGVATYVVGHCRFGLASGFGTKALLGMLLPLLAKARVWGQLGVSMGGWLTPECPSLTMWSLFDAQVVIFS